MALRRLASRLASVPFPLLPYPISDSRRRLLSFSTSSSTPPHFMAEYLLSACGLSPAEAARAAPRFSHLSSTARIDAALAFLRSQGLGRAQIRAIVSRKPALLLSDVYATLSPKFSAVRALGLSRSEAARLFAHFPSALTYGIRSNLLPRMLFWVELLGSTRLLMKCLGKTWWMLKFSVDQLLQNLSTLHGLGVPDSRITTVLRLRPSIIMQSSAKFQALLDRVEAHGFSRSHGMYMWSIFALHNINDRTLRAKKAGVIRLLGCSDREFTAMSIRNPTFMFVTEEMMRSKVEFVKTVLGCSTEYIIMNPMILTLSIEKRMAPRCRAIEALRSKGVDVGKLSMVNIMRLSKARFVEKYILKYKEQVPELLELYHEGQEYSSPPCR